MIIVYSLPTNTTPFPLLRRRGYPAGRGWYDNQWGNTLPAGRQAEGRGGIIDTWWT